MRTFYRVTGTPMRFRCIACHNEGIGGDPHLAADKRTRDRTDIEPMYADPQGPAFEAYYHRACARAIGADLQEPQGVTRP